MKKAEYFLQLVEQSYANNSKLYKYFADEASLQEIITFLYWDAKQPTFKDYIERWLIKTPDALKPVLKHHIEEELDHADLFSEMMSYLEAKAEINFDVDSQRLDALNYTFSNRCVEEQDFAFFCGGFFATEVMAGKRYEQLLKGFARLQIPKENLRFIVEHSECEQVHSMEALNDLIMPLLEQHGGFEKQLITGVNDRLYRSEEYLKWYEENAI